MNIKANLPQWLPRLVAERGRALCAEAITAGNEQKAAAIMQITTDPRMQRVWRVLREKHRPPRGAPATVCEHWYRYRVRDEMHDHGFVREGFTVRAEWLQEIGLRSVFEWMIRWRLLCRADPKHVTSGRTFMADADSLIRLYRPEELRALANMYDGWPGAPKDLLRKRKQALLEAEEALLKAAKVSKEIARVEWDHYQKRDRDALVTCLIGHLLASVFELSVRPCPHCRAKVDTELCGRLGDEADQAAW
jgi:hypothetical protein